MAERRMFAKTIIDSDAFIDMPVTARLLYYDLAMRADDDGFVNSPKKIMRMIGASKDDLSILIMRKFLIPFDNGVVVIKHWRIHNYIRKDTYNRTPYTEEMAMLELDENNAYKLTVDESSTERGRAVDDTLTQVRIGKDRLDKVSIYYGDDKPSPAPPSIEKPVEKSRKFVKPTVEQVRDYCQERQNGVNPEKFVDYYDSNGWKVGKNPMKDWKAAVRTWEKNGYSNASKPEQAKSDIDEYKFVINKF